MDTVITDLTVRNALTINSVWRNLKTGDFYQVVDPRVIDCTNQRDGTTSVAYRDAGDLLPRVGFKMFVREREEFLMKFEHCPAVPDDYKCRVHMVEGFIPCPICSCHKPTLISTEESTESRSNDFYRTYHCPCGFFVGGSIHYNAYWDEALAKLAARDAWNDNASQAHRIKSP